MPPPSPEPARDGRPPIRRGSDAHAARRSHDAADEPHLAARAIDAADADFLEEEPLRASAVEHESDDDAALDEPALAGTSGLEAVDRVRFPDFAGRWRDGRARTTPAGRLLLLAAVALAGGPLAVLAAFANEATGDAPSGFGLLAVVVFVPVIEEMLKIGLLLWCVEHRPWRLPGGPVLVLGGTLAGLGFGALENLVYLHVHFADRAAEIAAVRWRGTMPMHAAASTLAGLGVLRMHAHAQRRHEPPPVGLAFPWLVAAMTLHGAWNALASLAG